MTRVRRLVTAFDTTVDHWFDPIRGHPGPDKVFEVASHFGDWGLIWLFLSAGTGLRSDVAAKNVPRLVGLFAIESIVLNQGIKRIFRRTRPHERPEVSGRLREPITSSFPSGHASSAAFASVILTDTAPALKPLILPIAVLVATSRIHTRMHHPSDVVAGALVGWTLGRLAIGIAKRSSG